MGLVVAAYQRRALAGPAGIVLRGCWVGSHLGGNGRLCRPRANAREKRQRTGAGGSTRRKGEANWPSRNGYAVSRPPRTHYRATLYRSLVAQLRAVRANAFDSSINPPQAIVIWWPLCWLTSVGPFVAWRM